MKLAPIYKKLLIESKLLVSAPTEERIIKLISQYFMGSTISLKPTEVENTFDVFNSKGKINSVVVKLVKGKYRFEQQ
jgi:hypothetical protein